MKDLFNELEPDMELLRDGELVFAPCCWYLMASADFGGWVREGRLVEFACERLYVWNLPVMGLTCAWETFGSHWG